MSRLTRMRTALAAGALALAIGVAAITVVSARPGDNPPADKLVPPLRTAIPTAPVPPRLLDVAAGRSRYLSTGSLAALDQGLTTGGAAAVLVAWQRQTAKCFVGSDRTGALCEGQSGPTGAEHDVEGVRFQLYDTRRTTGQAARILAGLVNGNRSDLVMIARAAGSGHLLLGYRLSTPRAGSGETAGAYLYIEIDSDAAQPIVILGILDPNTSPVNALRNGYFGGSFGGLLAVDQKMLDDELRREP
jgi:hypothetical protein